jgi:hypothetical protein
MSDKWDEIANALVYGRGKENQWFYDASLGLDDIAAALRDAEKAGMERAAARIEELEEALEPFADPRNKPWPKHFTAAARAIRAAKATPDE